MKISILILTLIFLGGCVQPVANYRNNNAMPAENERALYKCMASYSDLLQKYNSLADKSGGLPPDDKELAEFISKYQDIRNKHYSLLEKTDRIKSENEKLIASQKIMQQHLESMENKLQSAQEKVSHLSDALHKKPSQSNEPPQNKTSFTTNPKTTGIIIENSFLFSPGSSTLSADGKNILKPLAETLKAPEYRKFLIRVDGHTDSTPVQKTKNINIDNWFLGAKRAHQVLAYLASSGIESSRLSLASFGANAPLEQDAQGEKDNSRNRRVEIVLIEKIKKIEEEK